MATNPVIHDNYGIDMGLHFKTLGIPELLTKERGTEGCLRLRYRKAYAVLGYLVIDCNRWHDRRRLADIFWPHLTPEAALANMRQVLKNLGDVFAGTVGVHGLRIERERLGLFFDATFHADVLLFSEENRAALRRCRDHDDFVRLTAAWNPWLEQLEGEFLAGIDADDGGEFENWLLLQRAACDRARTAFLREYLHAAYTCHATTEALKAARAWVRCRPDDDEAAQAQMELLATLDRPAAALDAYADFAQRLERLIGKVPGADTDKLRQRIAMAAGSRTDEKAETDAPPPDEVRRVVVLRVEPDLDNEADSLEPERHLVPLAAALDAALSHWDGRQFSVSGWALGAVFGMADDGEQAPRRALMAAMEITALPVFGRTRIGICEGKALVNPTARHPLAGSALPALAQRLALCGDAGNVIVAATLAQELGFHARFEPLARRRFTGLAGEHTPCRLLAASDAANNSCFAAFSTPFVGRREEYARLADAIASVAKSGRAAFVEVEGLPGNGKSRLLAELARQHGAAGGEIRWIGHRPELRHASLGALRENLRQRIAAVDGPTPAESLDRWLEKFFPAQRGTLRAPLRTLLALADDGAEGIAGRSMIDALISLLFSPSRTNQPILLVFDDLHWADEATRELLRIAIQSPPAVPILAILATRPATTHPGGGAVPRITLQPLAPAESMALIAAIDQDDTIGMAQRIQLAAVSGGLPLCTEYIARTARDQTVSAASLFGVLQSVLDRLGPGKQLLQAAAVLGTSFRGTALRALLPERNPEAALQQAETLAICRRIGEDAYAFHHALLRDCAYESIPPKLRRDWHRQAAAWLSQQPDAAPADIAQHFEAAHAWRDACDHWRQAAEAAYLDEFAGDAKEAAERALAAAAKNSEPLDAADKAELELLAGYATLMTEGYGSKAAQRFFAPTAARAAGDLPNETLFRALCGLVAATATGRDETLESMNRLRQMARTPAHRMMVCYGFGSFNFWRGKFADSLRYLEEAIEIGEKIPAREWLRYSADNPVVSSRAIMCVNLALSGTGTAALDVAARAVADARREGRAHALCFALTMAASTNRKLDRPEETERLSAEGLELSTQWHFQLWEAYNTMLGLWVKAVQGHLHINSPFTLMSMHRKFAAASRLSPVTSWWFVAAICEALESWALLDAVTSRALALAEDGGDRYCVADLMRQKSLAKHGRGDAQGARRWMDQAIAVAVDQGCLGLMPRFDRAMERIAHSPTRGKRRRKTAPPE